MNSSRTQYDITSADSKIIGFDYQFFYFMKAVLLLKRGQAAGYETKDDVHITLPNGRLILIQLKHTTKNDANGKPINLTELSIDLTKSLYNWVSIICDANDGRLEITSQIEFVNNTEFIFATNRNIKSNNLINNIIKYKNDEIKLQDLKKYIQNLVLKTENDEVKTYLNKFIKIDKSVFKKFVKKIRFENQGNEILSEIKELILDNYVSDSRVNDVFNIVLSELKTAYYEAVRKGEKFIVEYNTWHNKLVTIFENNRKTSLPMRKIDLLLPEKLEEQIFIKELIEIGDIDVLEIGQIEEFTTFMLEIDFNLKKWIDDGEITMDEMSSFKEEAILFWKNTHKASHRKTNNIELDKENAIYCLNEIRKKELSIQDTALKLSLCNGSFYKLANEQDIGWLKKWEGKYKK